MPGDNGGTQGLGSDPTRMGIPLAGGKQNGGRLPPGLIDAFIQFLQEEASP